MKPESPDFTYFMGVEISETAKVPTGFTEVILQPSQYASLKIIKKGNTDVKEGFEYLFKKWIPSSKYSSKPAPGFIYYDEQFINEYKENGYNGFSKATIYVPVSQK